MATIEVAQEKNVSCGNIRRLLLVLTFSENSKIKTTCFKGKYCYLRALMGVPTAPAGGYMPPGQEKGVSFGNYKRLTLVFILL